MRTLMGGRRVLVALCAAVLAAPATALAGDWPSFRFDAANSGSNSTETTLSPANVAAMTTRWHTKIQSATWSSPTVAGGRLYFTGGNKSVYALDASTGAILWSTEAPPVPYAQLENSAPVVSNGVVYVGTSYVAGVVALDATTGAVLWNTQLPDGTNVYSSPLVADGKVFITTDGADDLYALDATTGAVLWSASVLSSYPTPAVAGGVVYIPGQEAPFDPAYRLNAIDETTGHVLWQGIGPQDQAASSPAIVDGRVFFGSSDGSVYAYAAAGCGAATCDPLWKTAMGAGTVASPAVAGGTVFIGANDWKLYALDAASGAIEWTATTDNPITASPSVANGVVYVATRNGSVFAYAAAGCGQSTCSPLWSRQLGDGFNAFYASPAIANGSVFDYTYYGDIYSLGFPTNLLTNGSFEASTGGWRASNATVTRVSGGADGTYAARLTQTKSTSFALVTSPRPVTATEKGEVYSVTGSVRADTPGGSVCLRIREWSGTSVIGWRQSCVTATSSWQRFPTLQYTAHGGTQLDVLAIEYSTSASFDVDALGLTATGADTTPPLTKITSHPPPVIATRSATVGFTSNEYGSTYECSLDGNAFAPCTSPVTYSNLADGIHGVTVRAIDAAGNVDPSPPDVQWTVDTSGGLLLNGSFEGTTYGWRTVNASAEPAADGVVGVDAAHVALNVATNVYTMVTSTKPVQSTTAGASYTATGWLRSNSPGKSVCLRVREWAGATFVAQAQQCLVATWSWQQFPAVRYTARNSGDQIDVIFVQYNAAWPDSFDVDGLRLTSP